MGLGIITGAIAIARTATMHEIKSSDLSWDSLPNGMTRVFEVNIGNIAASAPILKPFVRFVQAKISGRDPHQILHRKTSNPENHERWYMCGWRVPGRWARSGTYGSSQQETDLPANVVKVRARSLENASMKTETTRTESIALPMQGVRKREGDEEITPDVPDIRNSHYYRLSRTPQTDSGEYFGVKEAV